MGETCTRVRTRSRAGVDEQKMFLQSARRWRRSPGDLLFFVWDICVRRDSSSVLIDSANELCWRYCFGVVCRDECWAVDK